MMYTACPKHVIKVKNMFFFLKMSNSVPTFKKWQCDVHYLLPKNTQIFLYYAQNRFTWKIYFLFSLYLTRPLSFTYEEPIFLHFFHGRIHLSSRIYVRTFWVHTKLTNDDRQRRNCGLHLLYVENFFLYTVKTNSFGGCGTWQIKPIGAILKAEYSKRPRYYRLNNKNRR